MQVMAKEKKTDIVFVSEIGKVKIDGPNWIADNLQKAAAWVPEPNHLAVDEKGNGNGFA